MSIDKYYNVLLAPVVSEKSTLVGEQANQYVFKVSKRANKEDVKKAIELFSSSYVFSQIRLLVNRTR